MEPGGSLPDALPEQTRGFLLEVVRELASVDGMAAIALGGSWARRTARVDSDIDLGLYYEEGSGISIRGVRDIAERWSAGHAPTVTELYEWGPWVNGGAWIQTRSGKVDFLYRNLDQVRTVIEEAREGKAITDYSQTPVYGFQSVTYLGETHFAIPLHDPRGALAKLKQRVWPYPPALKETIVQKALWGTEFTLSFARELGKRGDVYNTVGCLTRALSHLTQALFAINETYFMNDKGAIEVIEGFPIRPANYGAAIGRILAHPGETAPELSGAVEGAENLFRDVVSRAGIAYRPRFPL
jgi:hypothetical protein